jgi:hypothetical protein
MRDSIMSGSIADGDFFGLEEICLTIIGAWCLIRGISIKNKYGKRRNNRNGRRSR